MDWFVDGDDEIEPDMYELLLKNAERYGADISHCGYQMIFADGGSATFTIPVALYNRTK